MKRCLLIAVAALAIAVSASSAEAGCRGSRGYRFPVVGRVIHAGRVVLPPYGQREIFPRYHSGCRSTCE